MENEMKHSTPSMADTLASNGEYTLRNIEKKKPIGADIYNPITNRMISESHFKKLKKDGIDLSQLKRNCWIEGFDGTMSDEEFLNQDHIRAHMGKTAPTILPATSSDVSTIDHHSTIITQAHQMDDLTKKLNTANTEIEQLRHELGKIRESAKQASRLVDSVVRHCDNILGLDDDIPF
jgi:hypothetical protein